MGFLDTLYDAGKAGYEAWKKYTPTGQLVSGGLGGLGADADLSGIKEAQAKAFGLTDSLGAERAAFGGEFDPAMSAQNLQDLQAAAAGLVASPAELMLQRQAGEQAANQFGLAAALQGRNSGAALRSARIGSQRMLSDANLQAAQVRAQEQTAARTQLTAALSGIRGQDIDQSGQLLQGQIGALNAGTTAAGAGATASATAAGAKNQLYGSLISGGATALLSDEREKTDVETADLDSLASSLKGFNFKYKDPDKPGAEPGQRVGVMAQDVAAGGPIGKRIVSTGPDKRMRLDIGNAVGAALAMSAEALKRSGGRKAA